MNLRHPIALMLATLTAASTFAAPQEFFVYFGTYTKAPSTGIYRSRLNIATGLLSPAELAVEAKDPAFVALHPNGKFLYAIDESSDPKRTPTTGVSAYTINATTGALTLLNQQSAGGSGPCHLAVDRDGKAVLVANYGGGSVSAIALKADGSLGAVGSFIQHAGSSVNPARQKGPHAHEILVSADNRFAFAPDLGLDRIMVYQLDPARAKLTAHTTPFATLPPGSGPRHLAFHPGNAFAYVISEMLCTMTAFRYDAANGTFTALQTISTLPPGESVQPGTSTAEVVVRPDGKFLYGSNRGHNTIVVYAIDAKTGTLTYVENQSTQGKTPRHFAIDPTGAWLLAENQDSGTVAVLRIDGKTGRLTPTGQLIDVPYPVSAVFLPTK
jgi:6-phosphogluconolactonase